jgi:uncharacterized membrane protein YbaN (DUF454 family)
MIGYYYVAWSESLKRYVRIALGCALILIGLIGFLVPILQGWLFFGIGTMLLYRDLSFLQKMWERLKRRFPRVGRTVERIRRTFK